MKAVFDGALMHRLAERRAYIVEACEGDAQLLRQVETLLASHENALTFLDTPAGVPVGDTPAAVNDDLVGRTIGSYQVLSRLGAGGMGDVYLARDGKLDRQVALKLLPVQLTADPDRLRRFHSEARSASALNHPNILVVHDFGEHDGRPFIVMEYIEGQTLRRRLDAGAVPVREAIEIGMQVANALAAAHARGIVHRDVKPENVMVRPDGYVKVLDFGLAKLMTARAAAGDLDPTLYTQPGIVMGTPRYMSPEQARGLELDARTDVWSLGVILYEMVAGRPPFDGATPADVLAAILGAEPVPLDLRALQAPQTFGRLVARMLAKNVAGRFASARELHADLAALKSELDAGAGRTPTPRRGSTAPSDLPGIDSLAVLPFENASGDPDTEYLSDGITESLINRVSQIPGLRVVPRSTAFRYKGRDIDPHKVGRQLKVRTVLTGKVIQRGDTLSVQADLVDVGQQAQLWGERFVRRVSDIFAVEDEIAGQITDKLRLKVTGEERDRLGRRYTENTEAYHLFLKGRFYWSKRTRPNLRKSVEYFEQAIAKDAGYALAYAGLADSYVVMSVFDVGVPGDLMAKAKTLVRRALEIDPDLPEAHAELCIIWPTLDRDWDAADDAFRSVMKRTPKYWLAHDHYAMTLAARGRFEEALAEVRRGQALEPLSVVVHHHVAWICLLARRYDDAIVECRSAIDMDPAFPMAHLWLGVSLEQKGLYEEAIGSLDEAVKCMGGGVSIGVGAAAHAYAMSGRVEEARRRLVELQEARAGRYVEPYGIALVSAALGDREDALRWLEQAYQDHSFWLAFWAKVDPRLDVLRDDARFQDLLRRLGVGGN